MNREEKSATIQEIAAQIEGAEAIFAVDYRGISVPQAAELRGKLREADSSFRVVKNRLTKLAAEQAGEGRLADLLIGPTALTFVRGDTAAAAKAITTFNKEHGVLTYKGGLMGETVLDEAAFKSIARLPSREVLVGQFAGLVASPLTGVVRGLNALIQGLATQLGQIAEQGLVTGEAPAPATAGPVPDDGAQAEPLDDKAGIEDVPPEDVPPAGDAAGGTLPEEASATAGEGGSPAAAGPAAASADSSEQTSEDSNEEEG
ncbi:MAG: 50S ribosomal protein L10 [Actinobacteria bacterium]|nr:50S ribosomal protein L10 [Actinomycetota bacterium]